tara:strand:+ start:769 stop:1809 length:1041 start_codon:yes stop_codon:yes gene_type:complete
MEIEFEAAILVGHNKPLEIEKIRFENDLAVGQVLVELKVSGICGSQIGEIDGVKGRDNFIPHLMGHEGCGVIKKIGPGVTTVKEGDKVVLHWKKGSGINSEVPNYRYQDTKINAGWVTTFNKFAVVSENRVTSIPENVPSDYAALFGCAVTTGFGVIENNAKLRIGESIVILGAGGIGLNIIQAAKLVSAYPIIAVDIFDERLELAKKLGATHLINSRNCDFCDVVKSLVGPNLDVFIDNTGKPEIIEKGYELINSKGRLVLVGVPKLGSNINIFSLPLHFGKTITGSFGGETHPERDIPRYMNLLLEGKLSLDGIITERFSLNEINTAISRMRSGKTIGRVMIDF